MDNLILRVIADLSDLRYGDAIVRGREVMAYARFTLRTGLLGSATSTVQSSSTEPALASVLMFRALDGSNVLLAPGEYTATVTAVDARGDSVRVLRRLLVEGEPLLIVAPPTFDESRLLPERRRGSLTTRVVISALLGSAVFVATSFQKDGEVDDEFNPTASSARYGMGGFAIGVGTHWLSRGRRDADAVAANARLREDHRRAVEAAAAETEQRRNGYRVRVTVLP